MEKRNVEVAMYLCELRKWGGGESWLKCRKYLERARKSLLEGLGWPPRGPCIL